MKSACEYKFVDNLIDRWCKVYLVELLQKRFGRPLVNERGGEAEPGVLRDLYNSMVEENERIDLENKGIKEKSRKKEKIPLVNDKTFGRNFIYDPDLPGEFTAGCPYNNTLITIKVYVESGSMGLVMEAYSRRSLQKLAQRKLLELSASTSVDESKVSGDMPDIIENEDPDEPPTQGLPESKNTSVDTRSSWIRRVHRWRLSFKISSWCLLVLTIITGIAAIRPVGSSNSNQLIGLDDKGNAVLLSTSKDSIRVTIIPFYSSPRCPEIEIEKAIEERLKEIIEKQKLKVIVDLLPIDTIPDDKTPREAIAIGASRHASIVVYGRFSAKCPNLTSIEPRYELIDSSSLHSFRHPEITWAGVKSVMNDPMEIVYGSEVLKGLWYFIYWDLGRQAYEIQDFDNALKHFLSADSVINTGVAGYVLGCTYEKLDQREKAMGEFQRYLIPFPYARDALVRLGTYFAYEDRNQYAAEQYFKQLVGSKYATPLDKVEFAKYLNFVHRHGEAIRIAAEVAEEYPELIDVHLLLGDSYSISDNSPTRATMEYLTAIELAPDSIPLLISVEYRLLRIGALEKLQQLLSEQYRLLPNSLDSGIVGMYFFQIGKFDEAVALLRPLVYKQPLVLELLDYYIWALSGRYTGNEIPTELRLIAQKIPEATDHTNLLLAEYYNTFGNADSALFFYNKAFSSGYCDIRLSIKMANLLAGEFFNLDSAIDVLQSSWPLNYEGNLTLAFYLVHPERLASHDDSLEARELLYRFRDDYPDYYVDSLCEICSPSWLISLSDSMRAGFKEHFQYFDDTDLGVPILYDWHKQQRVSAQYVPR